MTSQEYGILRITCLTSIFEVSGMLQEKLKTVKTTLYITENNKKWLETQPRGQRTRGVNEHSTASK